MVFDKLSVCLVRFAVDWIAVAGFTFMVFGVCVAV